MKKTICTAAFAAFSLFGGLAYAQASNTILVEFQGPGGHSSSNYGRTSALHAASRAVIELQKAGLPLGSCLGILDRISDRGLVEHGAAGWRLPRPAVTRAGD